MKRIVFFLVVMVVCSCGEQAAKPPQNSGPKPRSAAENMGLIGPVKQLSRRDYNIENGKATLWRTETFYFSREGVLQKSESNGLDSTGKVTRWSKTSYNSLGDPLREVEYTNYYLPDTSIRMHVYEFDAKGRKIAEWCSSPDDGPQYEVHYEYNANGFVSRETHFTNRGNYHFSVLFSYDRKGNQRSKEFYRKEEFVSGYYASYDTAGRVEHYRYQGENGIVTDHKAVSFKGKPLISFDCGDRVIHFPSDRNRNQIPAKINYDKVGNVRREINHEGTVPTWETRQDIIYYK